MTLKLLLINSLIILNVIFSSNLISPPLDANWHLLQDYPILIEWTDYENFQWCKSKSTLSASIAAIQKILEDKENYPNVFKRIEKTKVDEKGNVHIILDMPFPFAGRDYIVKYSKIYNNDDVIYRFVSVTDSGVPIHEDYVRLIHAAGEWHLHSIDSSQTEVTYIWNGELLGDFPDLALTRAWKKQGQEVMKWLKEATE